MSTPGESGGRWSAPLDSRLPPGASSDQVADLIVVIWREIDQALHPVIGHRGVAALYHRSLTLTSGAFAWLATGHSGLLGAMDTVALRAVLAQQGAASAADGGRALFQAFQDLLTSLLGASLTERMLLPVWGPSSAGSSAPDPTR